MTKNLKRITVWIDIDRDQFSQDFEGIEKLLRSAGKRYKIVSVSEIRLPSDAQ